DGRHHGHRACRRPREVGPRQRGRTGRYVAGRGTRSCDLGLYSWRPRLGNAQQHGERAALIGLTPRRVAGAFTTSPDERSFRMLFADGSSNEWFGLSCPGLLLFFGLVALSFRKIARQADKDGRIGEAARQATKEGVTHVISRWLK